VTDDEEVRRLRAQVAELSKPRHRIKSALSGVLIVVACVLAPLSIVASWTAGIIGDTNRYVAMVGPLPADPAVQDAITSRAAQAVSQHLDVGALLSQVAPADKPRLNAALGKLSGPIDDAIASFVQKETQTVVSSSWLPKMSWYAPAALTAPSYGLSRSRVCTSPEGQPVVALMPSAFCEGSSGPRPDPAAVRIGTGERSGVAADKSAHVRRQRIHRARSQLLGSRQCVGHRAGSVAG
jgi:hypothetical protein